jgi:excisionase family DNA binding protein
METIPSNFKPEDYCGTTHAAKLTGLSVGTIQTLTEKGEFEGFKTLGGHRRISMRSISAYMRKMGLNPALAINESQRLMRVMVIDDDPLMQEIIRKQMNTIDHRVDVFTYSSGIQALLDMTAIEPDILITDMRMPGINGRELLASVRSNEKLKHCLCVAMSAMTHSELEADGGPPLGVTYVAKPVGATWIGGFLSAAIAAKTASR